MDDDSMLDIAQVHAPLNDVFSFCNRLAWSIGGPVLLHDASWGVVAYSTLNQQIDPAREAIILQRSVPDSHREAQILTLAEERISAGAETFILPAIPGVQERRVVGVVRLLGVVVGHIWAAESAGALHPDAEAIMLAASKQAALLFQVEADMRRQQRERFVELLLSGSPDEHLLAQYLGVPGSCPLRVVAIHHGGDTDLAPQVKRVAETLAAQGGATYLTLSQPDRLYVVFYCDDVAEASRTFAEAIAAVDDRLLVAAGRVGRRLGHAVISRRDADQVITYLQRTPGVRMGSSRTLRSKLTLMRVAEAISSQTEPFDGPLQGLVGLESDDRAEAVAILDAFFASAGNVSEAARHVHVHPNTFRYRLAKITVVIGVNLEDREDRLLLELDLLRERFRD